MPKCPVWADQADIISLESFHAERASAMPALNFIPVCNLISHHSQSNGCLWFLCFSFEESAILAMEIRSGMQVCSDLCGACSQLHANAWQHRQWYIPDCSLHQSATLCISSNDLVNDNVSRVSQCESSCVLGCTGATHLNEVGRSRTALFYVTCAASASSDS